MKLTNFFNRAIAHPQAAPEGVLDGLTGGSFVLLGGKECGRAALLRRFVEHGAANRKRIVALTSSSLAISPHAAILRPNGECFDAGAQIHEISVYGTIDTHAAEFVEDALRKCLTDALDSSEEKDDVILLLDDTAGYLPASTSRQLATLFGWRNLHVWLAQTAAYDFRRNPLVEPVLDNRPRVALPFSHAWSTDYSRLLHPSTHRLVEQANYTPGVHVDFVIERNWEGRLYRLVFAPGREPASRVHYPIVDVSQETHAPRLRIVEAAPLGAEQGDAAHTKEES